jgi:hypothetical protein
MIHTSIRTSITKEIPKAVVLDTLEVLIGQGDKDMAAKEEVVNSCWSQDPAHANLHAYFKLASKTIQLIGAGQRRTRRAAKCSVRSQATIYLYSPDPDPVSDPEREAPPRGRGPSARPFTQAATCTAIKPTTAAGPEQAAAADMMAAKIQGATTGVAIAGRGEKTMTVLQRRTTTHLAASSGAPTVQRRRARPLLASSNPAQVLKSKLPPIFINVRREYAIGQKASKLIKKKKYLDKYQSSG